MVTSQQFEPSGPAAWEPLRSKELKETVDYTALSFLYGFFGYARHVWRRDRLFYDRLDVLFERISSTE